VWRPLYRWVEQGYEMLYGGRGQAGWPVYVHEAELRDWQEEEKGIEWRLTQRIALFWPEGAYPVVDDNEFTIRWRGSECYVGNNSHFLLLKTLVTARGRNVSHEEVREALGNEMMSSDALRQVLARLKATLRDSDCRELAKCIVTRDRGYIRLETPDSRGG
jgi:hypothetical protein